MITRNFGVPPRGLVRRPDLVPAPQPGVVQRLRELYRHLLQAAGSSRPARLSPAERRKLFRVIEGGKT